MKNEKDTERNANIKHNDKCLQVLYNSGASDTSHVRNVIDSTRELKTSHVLANMRVLESNGYVISGKAGRGYQWRLTKQGREYCAKHFERPSWMS